MLPWPQITCRRFRFAFSLSVFLAIQLYSYFKVMCQRDSVEQPSHRICEHSWVNMYRKLLLIIKINSKEKKRSKFTITSRSTLYKYPLLFGTRFDTAQWHQFRIQLMIFVYDNLPLHIRIMHLFEQKIKQVSHLPQSALIWKKLILQMNRTLLCIS